ncbi:hypothetical protein A3Q56_06069 [Intoshia linei]|uniref:Rhodanese domain-containing protein n=1 Tax=Intoshia linei TaxID=1819745 RepID=A0A177AWI6_9BILA|nr:hypothetical protein A3Q56_06069 [Intoshia linei]
MFEFGKVNFLIITSKERSTCLRFATLLNSSINIIKHNMKLTHCDAESINIFKNYDVIIDATDNLIARYVLNDICVSLAKPIVSGAALSLYGQLTVYNYQNSPCFRCIHPVRKIDRNETCASAGVLGVVPCIIGMLQALEVIKMCTGMGEVLHEQMLLFDSMLMSFRKINLRKRSNLCNSCSSPEPLKIDYTSLCQCEPIPTIDDDFNISVQQYIKNNNDDIIIDVRPPNEYLICRIEKSKNIFLGDLLKMKQEKIEQIKDKDKMYIICRRGNASRIAARFLNSLNLSFKAINIVGGLESWSKFGDKMFPLY